MVYSFDLCQHEDSAVISAPMGGEGGHFILSIYLYLVQNIPKIASKHKEIEYFYENVVKAESLIPTKFNRLHYAHTTQGCLT